MLEWDPLQLATSTLKSLSLYRNGSKAGTIPRPHEMLATKISGLAVDTEYTFHLVLRTTGGTYNSPVLTCRTHKMTDLSGITVTPGFLPAQLKDSLATAVQRIGAKITDTVRIDTTHFVCTEPRGREWERAKEMNIPIVRPEWVEGCEREGRLVGVRGYYLDANPKDRVVGTNPNISSSTPQATPQRQQPPQPQQEGYLQTRPSDGSAPQSQPSAGPFSPNCIQQLPTASVSSANLNLDAHSQASVEKRMGRPMSPGSPGGLERRGSTLSAVSAEVPEGVEDGGPGPEVPPTPPPKDGTHADHEDDEEDEEDDDDDGDETEREGDTVAEKELEKAKEIGLAKNEKGEGKEDADGEGEGMQDVEL